MIGPVLLIVLFVACSGCVVWLLANAPKSSAGSRGAASSTATRIREGAPETLTPADPSDQFVTDGLPKT